MQNHLFWLLKKLGVLLKFINVKAKEMEESLHVFSVTYKKDLDKGKLAKFITFGEVPLGSASSDKNAVFRT